MVPCPTACVVAVNLASGLANPLPTLGIYGNSFPLPDGILAQTPGGNTILMALSNGTVVLYDATAGGGGQWVASRQDFTSLGGAAGGFNDNLFVADNHVLDAESRFGSLESTSGVISSGLGVFLLGAGLRTTASMANAPGTVERVSLTLFQTSGGTPTAEAPLVPSILTTPTVGQIGETILAFVRTLAIPANQSSILLLSVSGMTVLENNFDAPAPSSRSRRSRTADGTSAVAPGV